MSPSSQRATASLIGLSLVIAAWWVFAGPGRASDRSAGGDAWTVTHVVDGDTFDARRGGDTERVRLIGVDTPERGECGYGEAADALAGMIDGADVALRKGAPTDTDRYGRLLRYAEVDGSDVGLALIERGLAVARYDSRTGQPHPREAEYRAAQVLATPLCPEGP